MALHPHPARSALVLGAGGFIGSHLVRRLKAEGYRVRGVDLLHPAFSPSAADEFLVGDLRDARFCGEAFEGAFSEVYQLAADMGGAGYIFSGLNDADVMHNSALINLHVAHECARRGLENVFYSSSACVYPEENQRDPEHPVCAEPSAYPANPDSDYGWEKLFGERLYLAFTRNKGLRVRIARFHNIYGPEGTWQGGREKAPAAICRKVAETPSGGMIEIWGDGRQTRSFLYVDECIEAVRRLMGHGSFLGPVNIGSEEMVTINTLAEMVIAISGKNIGLAHIAGPTGVRGRNSDNRLIAQRLAWAPSQPFLKGLEATYRWIEAQVRSRGAGLPGSAKAA
jgi:GDP-D-mannose 3',5'-epimerase